MQFHLTQEQVPAEIQWLSELVGMERFLQILFFWTWTCIQVYSCVLRAVGDSIVPMVFIALGVCGLRVVWVLLVAPLLPHVLEYTVSCYQISWAVTSLLFAWYYYRKAPVQQLLRGVRPSETE